MTSNLPDLITASSLSALLGEPDLAVLDASLHLPAAARDARADFAARHIPGARLLDLASLVDTNSSVPQALPRPDQLAQRLAELGIAPGARIVLYDDSAIRSAARAWFMLKQAGWGAVAVLDGGLESWRAANLPLESGVSDIAPAAPAALAPASAVRSKAEMLANIASGDEQVLDARSADRVFGSGIDPVHGGQNGRIPGALNLPYTKVLNADGTYKSPADLRQAFEAAGIDLANPVVGTCGSGVTASVLLFALHLIGKTDTALYDGSWMEWAADPATPKEQGPAA